MLEYMHIYKKYLTTTTVINDKDIGFSLLYIKVYSNVSIVGFVIQVQNRSQQMNDQALVNYLSSWIFNTARCIILKVRWYDLYIATLLGTLWV